MRRKRETPVSIAKEACLNGVDKDWFSKVFINEYIGKHNIYFNTTRAVKKVGTTSQRDDSHFYSTMAALVGWFIIINEAKPYKTLV